MNNLKIASLIVSIIFSFTANAQNMKDYNKEWAQIEGFLKKGLTKSANSTASIIFNAAVKEKNNPQIIKAAMHLVGFRNSLQEESELTNHFFLYTLIQKSSAPAKNILQSMQAQLLKNYFEQNRWRFYNRTEQVQENAKDIQTWSLDKLHTTISNLYSQSLKNPTALQALPTASYDAIVLKGENTDNLRTTMYDLLAHRALEYFSNTEQYITKPSYYFKIEQPEAFDEATKFVNFSFKTKDTASNHFKAIKVYQELIAFRLQNANTDALLDADILRIRFVFANSVAENKSKLYKAALENIYTKNKNNAIATIAGYLLAQDYIYSGNSNDIKENYNKAISICNDVISKFPKSEGGVSCFNLLQTINSKILGFQLELVNIPNEAFRIAIDYKNVDKLYGRIIKTNYDEVVKWNKLDYDKIWKAQADLKFLKSFTIDLPKVGDYQVHKVEAKIDALEKGMYLLLVSTTPDFKTSNNILAKDIFHVSNIGLLKNNNEYHLLHRNTGQPLANASIKVWENYYDYNERKDVNRLKETKTSDKNGYFKVIADKDRQSNLRFDIKHNDDNLQLLNSFYSYYDGYTDRDQIVKKDRSFIFTDRSIYRPGQSLYFKGIVIAESDKPYKATVVANKKVKVNLFDANYQKINTIELTTNEYGSYNGVFTLPTTGLMGQFFLQDSTNNNQTYISVEEYKRPKFSVAIQQPKGSYRVNDSIKVTGNAKAFAGNNIDGAKVKYRVTRKTVYPIWWDNWGYFGRKGEGRYNNYGKNDNVEITNGDVKTNEKGEFIVTFKAIPDETIEKKSQPTFYYELNADVTDINGETRTGNISIPVSYQALQINIENITKIDIDSFKKIAIQTKNTNGAFEPATVKITIHALNAPKTYLRNRYWETPDQFLMSEEEFKRIFPLDIYKEEDKKANWQKGKMVLDATYLTKENDKFSIPAVTNLSGGHYVIEVETKDKYGELVTAKQYIEITDKVLTKDFKEAISIVSKQSILQPNDNLYYSLQTSFDRVFAIHENNFMNEKKKYGYESHLLFNSKNWRRYEQLEFGIKTEVIPVTEDDRGGINASVSFVKYNRIFGTAQQFYVPWRNKELNISFETFRDKTLPGSEEEYKIKITGTKGDKLAAEMLATMYDASLDQIKPHQFNPMNLYPSLYTQSRWGGEQNFMQTNSEERNFVEQANKYYAKQYDAIGIKIIKNKKTSIQPLWWLNPLDYAYGETTLTSGSYREDVMYDKVASPAPMAMESNGAPGAAANIRIRGVSSARNKQENDDSDGTPYELEKVANNTTKNNDSPIQVRKNFNETAFFIPDLKTDADGNVIIKYTIPEALTEWKLLALAHTKDLAIGTTTKKLITQKPLMVQPNLPRFVREGDKIDLAVKIVNLGDKEITGTSQLELINPETNQPVDGWFKNLYANQYFTAPAGQSVVVNFPIEIPFNYNKPLIIRTIAKAIDTNNKATNTPLGVGGSGASDAEENIIPVVTNRMLVTETMPLPMKGIGTKTFKFEKLLKSGTTPLSSGEGLGVRSNKEITLTNQGITVEYTSNPAWYAIQALPYLMEYPYECAEQTFNRYYANALASKVANSNPKIKAVFDKWASPLSFGEGSGVRSLQSNLEKNEELKSALLQETPWVMDAQNETQQKKNIALLFDLNKMADQLKSTIQKLKEMQSSNGGFVWFKGGRDDRYITQYILTGIGHLKKLGALDSKSGMEDIINKAIPYLDARMKEDYDNLLKIYKTEAKIPVGSCGNFQLQYLYMRSFFPEKEINNKHEKAYLYFLNSSEKSWLQQSKYMQAMTALVLHRYGAARKSTANAIMKSLKENAIVNEELGMYWKDIVGGYYWHQAPIETMSLMVETFSEVGNNIDDVNALRTWLIKNKQTSNWKTTKATAEACYAFLLQGTDFLNNAPKVTITLGNTTLNFGDKKESEAGTLYSKTRIEGEKVKPEMGNIVVTVSSPLSQGEGSGVRLASSWGGVYWQYFEDLDKIKGAETPLKLQKKIFKETITDKGKKLTAVKENDAMQVGDKMIIRIELRVDRYMEYIHMKDMRSSGTEPINVLSQYKWQDGLGYYESTKDVSTNFFFNYLPKGTYVFEYPLFVTHKGNFSNGITTIQCMYAPEFTSHSEGVRVNVE